MAFQGVAVTRALATLDELKAALKAARDHQVYVEDHSPACTHDRPELRCQVCEARAFTDAAFQAVLDAIRQRS